MRINRVDYDTYEAIYVDGKLLSYNDNVIGIEDAFNLLKEAGVIKEGVTFESRWMFDEEDEHTCTYSCAPKEYKPYDN